jgi:Glu-tRNA(Gln) amidotransferase subunit E-like FAD-binding protein
MERTAKQIAEIVEKTVKQIKKEKAKRDKVANKIIKELKSEIEPLRLKLDRLETRLSEQFKEKRRYYGLIEDICKSNEINEAYIRKIMHWNKSQLNQEDES